MEKDSRPTFDGTAVNCSDWNVLLLCADYLWYRSIDGNPKCYQKMD